MLARIRFIIVATAVAGALAATAQAVEVKLKVEETAQAARSPGLITMGVPFARGVLRDVKGLSVSVSGKPAPAQFARTVAWDDGSVRWALLDTQADLPAGGKTELTLSDAGSNPAPANPVKVEDAVDAVMVSTGPLQFVISKKKSPLFGSLKVDGKELFSTSGRGLVVYKDGGEFVAAAPLEVKVEQPGPMRAAICLRGKFPGAHKIGQTDLLAYTLRISAFAGQKFVKVHVWLENQGAMGYWFTREPGFGIASKNFEWFLFKGMAVELGVGLGERVAAACEGVESTAGMKVLQVCKQTAAPVPKGQYAKPPFYTWDNFEYTITGGGKELRKGDRTDGVLSLKGDGGTMTAAVRDFWQNYEKAVELDGKTLKLWLWPVGGQWPRLGVSPTYYYDQSLDDLRKNAGYYLPGAVHKGYEFVLDFLGRDAKQSAAELSHPLMALASAEYYASTEAAPGLFAPPEVRTADKDCNAKLDAWMRSTRSVAEAENPTGLYKARQTSCRVFTPWFGWMDFGDIFVPGSGPAGLHYDWTWVMLLNLMRTGDVNFMRLGADMARHRIDVDQLWSDRDVPAVSGLQRGEFNYTDLHCYRLWVPPTPSSNWLAGVALYYMLTGEPKALECCLRNGAGLKAAWAAPRAPRADMAANAWAISSCCALYDLTADKKWLDEALGLFRTNVAEKRKHHGPFLHDPTYQIQGQSYIQDDAKYCCAIGPFCDLHRHTGDEAVLKLLTEGCEKEFPESFFEAPLFLADLYAYVGHRTGKAVYLKKAADLFAQGFPESKSPPVFLPDNSTWSRQSAMMFRAGHLLQYAHWKTGVK